MSLTVMSLKMATFPLKEKGDLYALSVWSKFSKHRLTVSTTTVLFTAGRLKTRFYKHV